jgi:hypothetical protein
VTQLVAVVVEAWVLLDTQLMYMAMATAAQV